MGRLRRAVGWDGRLRWILGFPVPRNLASFPVPYRDRLALVRLPVPDRRVRGLAGVVALADIGDELGGLGEAARRLQLDRLDGRRGYPGGRYVGSLVHAGQRDSQQFLVQALVDHNPAAAGPHVVLAVDVLIPEEGAAPE